MKENGTISKGYIRIDEVITKIASIITWISVACLVFVMVVAFVDVVTSKFLNVNVPGSYEMIEMCSVPILYCSMCYCHLTRGQMCITLIRNRLPKWGQDIIIYCGHLLGIFISLFMAWHGFRYTLMLKSKFTATSGSMRLLQWPFCLIMVIGLILLALAYAMTIVRKIIGYNPYPSPDEVSAMEGGANK